MSETKTIVMTLVTLIITLSIFTFVFNKGIVGAAFGSLVHTRATYVALELQSYLTSASYAPGNVDFSYKTASDLEINVNNNILTIIGPGIPGIKKLIVPSHITIEPVSLNVKKGDTIHILKKQDNVMITKVVE